MANWCRKRDSSAVHVTPDAAPGLCGIERDRLGATIWDAGIAAKDLCQACSLRILAATTIAIAATERIASARELETAKEAMRSLLRIVPDGVTRDLIVYARACVVRGDTRGAHEALKTWRSNMRAIGIFGQDD